MIQRLQSKARTPACVCRKQQPPSLPNTAAQARSLADVHRLGQEVAAHVRHQHLAANLRGTLRRVGGRGDAGMRERAGLPIQCPEAQGTLHTGSTAPKPMQRPACHACLLLHTLNSTPWIVSLSQ